MSDTEDVGVENKLTDSTIDVDSKKDKPWFCYILESQSANRTYVGATNNHERRIRQHNGEITGGARATKQHRPWKTICLIGPFEKKVALQLEWRLHRRFPYKKGQLSIERRKAQLEAALAMERWTLSAPFVKDLTFDCKFLS